MAWHTDAPTCHECGSIALHAAKCTNCGVVEARPEIDGLVRDKAVLDILERDVEAALEAQVHRARGGQQAGHGPALSYAPRSVLLDVQRTIRSRRAS